METAAVIKQRSKFAEQFAAIAEEHARSDFSREKFELKKNLEKFGLKKSFDFLRIAEEHALLAEQEERERLAAEGKLA